MQNVTKKPGSYQSKKVKQNSLKNSMASVHTHILSAHSHTSARSRLGEMCVYVWQRSTEWDEFLFCPEKFKRILHNSALCSISDLEKVRKLFLHLPADFKGLVCAFDREYVKLWVALDESDHHSFERNTKRHRRRASGKGGSMFLY